ncbi:MAG: hypothetical protein R3B07_00915 [Polyangiaceae bacterium]
MSHDAVLSDAVCETFASLAFLDLMPSHSAVGKQEEPCVSIDVFEPLACNVSISIPALLLDEIAVSATGGEVEGEALEGAKRDLLLEVANVVAGAFAARVQDGGAHVELGLPRLESPASSKTWQRFETESSWVDVSLELRSEH